MPGYVVAGATELRAINMTGVTETRLRFVEAFHQWYRYSSTGARADNGEWIIAPTTGGGNWTPVGPIYGTSTPTGAVDTPTIYHRVTNSSLGNFTSQIYSNPGGGSADWNSVALA